MVSRVERDYHDKYASRFEERKLARYLRDYLSDPLWKEILPLFRGKDVLEIGCGMGFDSVTLASLGYHVRAIDISPTSIDRARRLASLVQVTNHCSFEVVDLNDSTISGSYDMIFGRAVLHHLTVRPLQETLSILRSTLNDDGRMLFVEPLDSNPVVQLNRKVLDVEERTPTEKPLGLWPTIRAFEAASLSVKHREYYLTATLAHFFRNVLKNRPMFWSSQKALQSIDSVLMDSFWPLESFAWISLLVAQKEGWHG